MASRDEPLRVVIATRNAGKLEEMRRILQRPGLTFLGLDDFPGLGEVEETGASFLENALLKARATAREAGLPAIADDSGLAVGALGGAPGVRSARYAGEPRSDARNNEKLLAAMRDLPEADRGAEFVCVAAAALPSGEAIWEEGRWRGRVLGAPRGGGGFGYDPLFLDVESGLSSAEMAPAQKDARSHRGKALRMLAPRLEPFLWGGGAREPRAGGGERR